MVPGRLRRLCRLSRATLRYGVSVLSCSWCIGIIFSCCECTILVEVAAQGKGVIARSIPEYETIVSSVCLNNVQFALLPLHNRLHTSIMHSYIHMNIHASHDLFNNICSLLLFQDSKANVVYDLRHDRITQSFESIDAFRDACCYSWDVGLSLESEMSVQPCGYPISHSTHSGFNWPLPGFCFSSIATRSSKFPL